MTEPNDRIESKEFTLVGSQGAPHLYADGMSQMMLGFPNSKLLLHVTINPPADGTREARRGVAWLNMPTATLIEMASIILATTKQAEGELAVFSSQHTEKLQQVVRQLDAGKPVPTAAKLKGEGGQS